MNKYLIIIFMAALALRLVIAVFSSDIPTYDAAGYDDRAMSIVRGEGYGSLGKPTAFKEPLYSFFLAVIYYVFGHNYLAARIAQAVLSASICVLAALIGRELFNQKIGISAAAIAAVNPSFITACGLLLSETLFTFLLIAAVFYLIRVNKTLSLKDFVILGILFALGSLTRSSLVFFPFLTSVILPFFLKNRCGFKAAYLKISIMLMFFLITIAPWTMRNWLVFHQFVPISTNVGINIYSSYFPPNGSLFGFTASDKNTEYAGSLNSEAASSKYLLRKSWERISKLSPFKLFKLEVLKALYFWCPFDWEIIGNGRYNFIYGFILPFLILGVFFTFKSFKGLIFLYLPITYFFLIALVTYGSPRFRLPIEPYLIILSSAGLSCFIGSFKKKNYALFSAFGYFFLNVYFYLNSYWVKGFAAGLSKRTFPNLF